MLQWLRSRSQRQARALELYGSSVAQARQPAFYRDCHVADTLDGRFEVVMLHVAMLLRRLSAEGESGRATGRAVVEQMFAALDDDMRELGVGDLTVPKRIHKAASAFYGRLKVYDDALKASNKVALITAVERNFPPVEGALVATKQLAAYIEELAGRLEQETLEGLTTGRLRYPQIDGDVS